MKAKIFTFLILTGIGVFEYVRDQYYKTNTAYQAEAFVSLPNESGVRWIKYYSIPIGLD